VPIIYLGSRFANSLRSKTTHVVASIIFAVLDGLALRNAFMNTPLVS
jgi:hypothetical protein